MTDYSKYLDECLSAIKSDPNFGLNGNRDFYDVVSNTRIKLKNYLTDYYEDHKTELGIVLSTFMAMARKEVNKVINKNIERQRTEEHDKQVEEDKKLDFYILVSEGRYLASRLKYWYSIGFRIQENTHAIPVGDNGELLIILINQCNK